MSVTARKAVLLRFDPELLERVDVARGALKRTEWLMDLIERGVVAVEPPTVAPTTMRIYEEDGSYLGLYAWRRENGVLEIESDLS